MTENLEPAFSRLQVFDAKGVEMDKRDTRVNGAIMVVSLQKPPPGACPRIMQAVAIDTHRTSGTFEFTIR